MEICKTQLSQENYNILTAGISQDSQIEQENEQYRQQLAAQEAQAQQSQ